MPKEILVCMHDNSMKIIEGEYPGYYCEGDMGYFASTNQNQNYFDRQPIQGLLAAELSVFAGNLLRFILGPEQPTYYLMQSKDEQNPSYYRVLQFMDNFETWKDLVEETDNEIHISYGDEKYINSKIDRLTSILVAGHFIGEIDWNENNFGLIPNENGFTAIRIDTGESFDRRILRKNYSQSKLIEKFNNLLISYVFKEINEEQLSDPDIYLKDLIDVNYDLLDAGILQGELRDTKVADLFSNKEEILKTLISISKLDQEGFLQIAKNSFIKEHMPFARTLICQLEIRKDLYSNLIETYESELAQDSTQQARPQF